MKKLLRQKHKCPYIRDADCGRPNKFVYSVCNDTENESWKECVSYKLLKTVDDYEEEKKDGKQDA